MSQQAKGYALFADDYDGNVPLQYGSYLSVNSGYYMGGGTHYNFGQLWRAGIMNEKDILICPSQSTLGVENSAETKFAAIPGGKYVNPFHISRGGSPPANGQTWEMSDDMNAYHSHTYYGIRPVTRMPYIGPVLTNFPIDYNLVKLDDYAELAILSEFAYMRFIQGDSNGVPFTPEVFHGNQMTAAYGDGHVHVVGDSTGNKFISRMAVDKGNDFYQTEGAGFPKPNSYWAQLDADP